VIASKSRSHPRQAGIHYTKSRLKVAMANDVLAWTTLLLDQNCHAFAAFVIFYQTG
jgi:hypothetical protein